MEKITCNICGGLGKIPTCSQWVSCKDRKPLNCAKCNKQDTIKNSQTNYYCHKCQGRGRIDWIYEFFGNSQ